MSFPGPTPPGTASLRRNKTDGALASGYSNATSAPGSNVSSAATSMAGYSVVMEALVGGATLATVAAANPAVEGVFLNADLETVGGLFLRRKNGRSERQCRQTQGSIANECTSRVVVHARNPRTRTTANKGRFTINQQPGSLTCVAWPGGIWPAPRAGRY